MRTRRHHNNSGTKQIKTGATRRWAARFLTILRREGIMPSGFCTHRFSDGRVCGQHLVDGPDGLYCENCMDVIYDYNGSIIGDIVASLPDVETLGLEEPQP